MDSKRNSTSIIVFSSLCIVINIAGSFLALALRLPVYLDTIGTILGGVLLGPVYGMIIGALTGLINGITFDPVSLYYIPVQMIIGFLTGLLFHKHKLKSFSSIWKIILITLAGSIASSIITSFVFSGITSSGSSYIVAALRSAGVSILTSVFSIQILTDLLDKTLSFIIVYLIIRSLPKSLRERFN